jgi:hypothetical protein
MSLMASGETRQSGRQPNDIAFRGIEIGSGLRRFHSILAALKNHHIVRWAGAEGLSSFPTGPKFRVSSAPSCGCTKRREQFEWFGIDFYISHS